MGSIKKAFDLTGKNALVTGGSRGLGLQIAEALGEQGARVLISSRKAPDLEKAQTHLAGLGIKAEWIAADNSKDEDVKRLADEAIKKLGRVDILVNNAGATWGAPTEDHPIEAWDKVMNLNIRSLFLLSQQIAKHSMIPNKYGRIINLASIAGLFGSSGDMQMVAYFKSRDALVVEALALAMDRTVAHWLDLTQGLPAEKGFDAVVEAYLSSRHRNNPARGCALPALAADIGRSGPEARRTFAGRLEKMIDIIAGLIPKRSPSDARQAAAGAIATMVGSIVLARAAGDKRLSDALLEAGRQAVRNQTGSATAEASPADRI